MVSVDTSVTDIGIDILSTDKRVAYLRKALTQQSAKIRSILKHRAYLEATAGSENESPRLSVKMASLGRELDKVISRRNRYGRELENILTAGQPESDESDLSNPKATDAVRLYSPSVFLSLILLF